MTQHYNKLWNLMVCTKIKWLLVVRRSPIVWHAKARWSRTIFKVFRFQRKTLYWFCCLFSIIIIFLLDATLTGNISVVYEPIPVKFSAHKARVMLFLKTPKKITNTLPVQSYCPFPNFLTAILFHQRLWGTFKKAKNEHRNLKYKHWNCAGSANL